MSKIKKIYKGFGLSLILFIGCIIFDLIGFNLLSKICFYAIFPILIFTIFYSHVFVIENNKLLLKNIKNKKPIIKDEFTDD